MKNLICLSLLTGFLSSTAFGQDATTITTPSAAATSTSGELQVSNFSMSLDTETATVRNPQTKNIHNLTHNIYPFLHYKAFENTNFSAYAKISLENSPYSASEWSNEYVAFMAQHNDVFTEEAQGFDFFYNVRYYANLDKTFREANRRDGILNLRGYLNKSITEKFAINNEVRFYFMNTNELGRYKKLEDKTTVYNRGTTHEHLVKVIPTYELSDELTSYLEIQYYNVGGKDPSSGSNYASLDMVSFIPGLEYTFSDDLAFGAEISYSPIVSHDETTIANSNLTTTPFVKYSYEDKVTANFQMSFPLLYDKELQADPSIGREQATFFDEVSFQLDLSFAVL